MLKVYRRSLKKEEYRERRRRKKKKKKKKRRRRAKWKQERRSDWIVIGFLEYIFHIFSFSIFSTAIGCAVGSA